jgi:polysaccharide pyruvyl transferase WcaK-like protein
MKICIIGDVNGSQYYHLGDEAMFTASVDELRTRYPLADIVALSEDSKFTSRRHGIDSINIPSVNKFQPIQFVGNIRQKIFGLKRLPTTFRERSQLKAKVKHAVHGSDVLFISGAGNLASEFPHHVFYKSLCARYALNRGIPVIVSGQTLGPYLTRKDKRRLMEWLPKVSVLCLRDEKYSISIARELGVPAHKIIICIDDAFSLKASFSAQLKQYSSTSGFIAVSLYCKDGKAGEMAAWFGALFDALVSKYDLDIVFIPHVIRSNKDTGDIDLANLIRERMTRRDKIRVISRFFYDREAKWLTSQARLVISSRYHGLVFSLSSGVPSVGISVRTNGYTESKVNGIFEFFDPVCKNIIDWTEVTPDSAFKKISGIIESGVEQRNSLERSHAKILSMIDYKWEAIARAMQQAPSFRELGAGTITAEVESLPEMGK